MLQKTKLLFKSNWEAVVIAGSTLALRIPYLSNWLEDWDSVQFALALHNFSIVDHLPHPPGYPAYIFINRILNFIFESDTLTLTFFSAVSGSLLAIPFYFLAREFMDERSSRLSAKKIALIMTILFLSLPIVWNLSEVGLTNIPGMALTIICAYLLLLGKDKLKYLVAGSFLSGMTLGIRFAEFSILLSLILLVLIYRRFSGVKFSVLLFGLGVSIWLIPMIIDTGLFNFIHAYFNHIGYIKEHDSIKTSLSIIQRLNLIWQLIILGFTNYIFFFVFIVVFGIIFLNRKIFSFNFLFLGTWFLSYFIPLLLIYNIEIPRYTLPLAPPFFLLVGLIIQKLKFGAIFLIPMIILTGLIFNYSFDKVYNYKHSVPPTIKPTFFVKENFSPGESVLITSFTYRQFQYYLPEYKNFWGISNAPKEIVSRYLITDYLPFKDYYPKYKLIQTKKFTENKSFDTRIPQVNLYLLGR